MTDGWLYLRGSYAFVVQAIVRLGIDLAAEEVEEPFGEHPDDSLLEDYCQKIQKFVMSVVGPLEGQPCGEQT